MGCFRWLIVPHRVRAGRAVPPWAGAHYHRGVPPALPDDLFRPDGDDRRDEGGAPEESPGGTRRADHEPGTDTAGPQDTDTTGSLRRVAEEGGPTGRAGDGSGSGAQGRSGPDRGPDPETSGRMRIHSDAAEGTSVTVGHVEQRLHHLGEQRRRRFPGWVVVVALALAVGLVLGTVVSSATGSADVPTLTGTASPVPSPRPSDQMPWQGAVRPVGKVTVTASCTADPRPDAKGDLISYRAEHVLDDDPATAWRCNGTGKGQRLTLTVPSGTELVGVGLVNGYTKTAGSTDLYPQYRRVLKVRWSLPDGSWFVQDLTDDDPSLQTLMIAPHRVSGPVVMTILASSEPGRPSEPTRDAVLVSGLKLFTRA